ncbi:hypothetical protein [Flavobacterium sp.]|jgi:hypothetical protein|uniref:hypothetical protein n=1 Tax=Flavobacterium sp. TaxID=239 RepID=UPI00260BFADB|nr:hypothetical protein [Flavobacterium sp.]MDG2432572.1 hypothetical protein [Flavobacterium sp.]
METEIENVFENRKEFMIHLLKFLNEKPKGVELGEFFFSIMPSHGIENFQEILVEMKEQKWINILETPSFGNIGGMQIPTSTVKYTIAIGGIEYLDKLKIIIDKYKIVNKKNSIKINGNVIDSNINQDSLSFESQNKNSVKNIPAENPKHKSGKENDIWDKLKTIAMILGFLTAVIGIITKLMDLW